MDIIYDKGTDWTLEDATKCDDVFSVGDYTSKELLKVIDETQPKKVTIYKLSTIPYSSNYHGKADAIKNTMPIHELDFWSRYWIWVLKKPDAPDELDVFVGDMNK